MATRHKFITQPYEEGCRDVLQRRLDAMSVEGWRVHSFQMGELRYIVLLVREEEGTYRGERHDG